MIEPRKEFARELKRWYQSNARDLPWRRTKDPYRIWISEVMLQQTTVAAVIPYYEKWLKVFPDVKSVARAPLQKVLKVWQGLGYYQRAKNIHKAAKIIVEKFQSQMPEQVNDLRGLPGFGPYTTGAVLSIAFDQRQPIIDANVRRVMMRQLAIEGTANPSVDVEVESCLQKIMPRKGNNIFNQALMELGALICKSKQPACLFCPVAKSCAAYEKGIQELIPQPKVNLLEKIEAAIAVIEQDGKFLIQKRPRQGLFADLWEFPGGKIEKGESAAQALFREVKEEVGVSLKSAQPMMNVEHFYTRFRVNLHVWRCQVQESPVLHSRLKFVFRNELKRYPMPSGSAKIVERLLQKFKKKRQKCN